MQDLKVGMLQFDQVWQNKLANYKCIESYFTSDIQLDLLLIPEMFHTGFSMDTSCADNWMDSEGLHFLKQLAIERGCAIYTSLMVKNAGYFYNRGVFIEPNQEPTVYDKRKAFGLGGEAAHFTTGQKETIVNFKGWNINLQICYDLRFPELVRNRIEMDGIATYDLLLYVANWPQKRILHWDSLLRARAIENQCYVLGCNRVGKDANDLVYNGHSQAVDMLGNYIQEPPEQAGLYVVNLSWSALHEGRKMLPFLKDA